MNLPVFDVLCGILPLVDDAFTKCKPSSWGGMIREPNGRRFTRLGPNEMESRPASPTWTELSAISLPTCPFSSKTFEFSMHQAGPERFLSANLSRRSQSDHNPQRAGGLFSLHFVCFSHGVWRNLFQPSVRPWTFWLWNMGMTSAASTPAKCFTGCLFRLGMTHCHALRPYLRMFIEIAQSYAAIKNQWSHT